jgi:spiro-SPASM protein
MNHAVVINALVDYRPTGTSDLRAALLDKAGQLAPREHIWVVADEALHGELDTAGRGFGKIAVTSTDAAHVLERMHGALRGYEEMVYFFIDTPLLDIEISREMLALHLDEIAEYTYGEGFPVGFTPEVLQVGLLPKIRSLLGGEHHPIARDTLFKALQKQINSFDIETYFSPRDMTLRRIELTLTPMRNGGIVERVVERGGVDCGYDYFCDLLEKEPLLRRTLPAYVEVEMSGRVNHDCPYLPLDFIKRDRTDMEFERYRDILERLESFTDDLYVSLSFLGEPLLHDDIRRFVEHTVGIGGFRLILETDGQLLTPDFADWLASLQSENLYIVVDVDAVQESTYRSIWGGDLRRVERNIRYLLSRQFRNLYVQMVRVDDTEREILQFYDQWEKEGAQVIIQKYNSFLGLLPQISGSDLRPLERQPCWHLLRDLVILHNGDVPRCKQDINAEFPLGNLVQDPIEKVWEGNARFYLDHCAGDYDPSCAICDEYYTFNF